MLGVLEAVTQHPEVMKDVFVDRGKRLQGEDLIKLYSEINWSEQGSNSRLAEERTLSFFYDYIMQCEGYYVIELES